MAVGEPPRCDTRCLCRYLLVYFDTALQGAHHAATA